MSEPSPRVDLISLREATVGGTFRIETISGGQCERLREMGFCESMELRKMKGGRNLICLVCGTKLAVSRELAAGVMVTPICG